MPYCIEPLKYQKSPSFNELWNPVNRILALIPTLKVKGNKPLQMEFEHQLKALIFYHLEEHSSGRHLLQVLKEDDFARNEIAPPDGIEKSSFFEAINNRGLEQLVYVFQCLQGQASQLIPSEFESFGELIAIDGSLID